MLFLSAHNSSDSIVAFNSTLRYQDDKRNVDNLYLEQMLSQICH